MSGIENEVAQSLTLCAHLTRQAAFSRKTFGPGARTKGVSDHIRKELVEVENALNSELQEFVRQSEAIYEWTDVAILGLDGLTRAIWDRWPEWTAEQVATQAVKMIMSKQTKNEGRTWPDWRTAPADKAIEHVRGVGE